MKGEKTLALFKIFKGKKINLPKTYNEGYCYFTEDDGKFYIDTTLDASGRKCLNAGHADSADTANQATKADSATRATTAGSADAVAWNNISGKPDNFIPSAHDHERIKLKEIIDHDSFYQDNFLTVGKYNINAMAPQAIQDDDISLLSEIQSPNPNLAYVLSLSNISSNNTHANLNFTYQGVYYVYSQNGADFISDRLATDNDIENVYNDLNSHVYDTTTNPHNITLSTFSVTATKDELNVLDGITATTQELNYTDGVTSNIQTQLNGKAASSHTHSNYASSVTTTGSGNAITAISQSGNTITATKGNTFALSNHTHNYAPIVDGLIPSTYLPSYVDDVIEGYYNGTSFYKNKSGTTYSNQITGETGKIYTDLSTEKIYRWSGSKFVVISETLALGETSSTAYAGNKGKANADAITALQTGKADANHTHNVYVNQNAFSNIKINSGTTPIAATSTTDTFNLIAGNNVTITSNEKNITISSKDTNTTYSAGTGISITGTANTITNTGVRSIISGSTNGTINVNTNGTTADVKVKGLGSAAYTNSSDYQNAITGAASTITGSNLTANQALVSNASGKVAVSSVTSTELGYLSGVTSAIQTQLNDKPGKIVKTVSGSNTNTGEIFNAYSYNVASGNYSHAEGKETKAIGHYSHAEGQFTKAVGNCSHVEGYSSEATGKNSHAEGTSTIAASDYQHVMGKYNIKDSLSDYAFIIGNGTGETSRSNAFAVDWNGGTWITNSELETAYNNLLQI